MFEHLESRALLASLDPTFNAVGTQDHPFPYDTQVDSYAVIDVGLLSDGKILTLVRHTRDFQPTQYVLVRYNPDGALDRSFNGVLPIADVPFFDPPISDLLVTSDDRVLVAVNDAASPLVKAYTRDGNQDEAFTEKLRNVPAPAGLVDFSDFLLALAPDGDIYLVRSGTDAVDDSENTVASTSIDRLNADGTPDNAFGDSARIQIGKSNVLQIAVQPTTGDLLIRYSDGSIERVKPDGTVVSAGLPVVVGPIALQSDGKILTMSSATGLDDQPVWLNRFNADGSLDMSYGVDGQANGPTTLQPSNFPLPGKVLTVDSQDRAVVFLGQGDPGLPAFMLRWTEAGQLDTSVATSGEALNLDIETPYAAVLQSDGKFVVGSGPFRVSRITDQTVAPITLSTGTLSIHGTDAIDTITVAPSGDNFAVIRNGADTTYPSAQVQRIVVDTGLGDDTVTISLDLAATVFGGSGNNTVATAGGNDFIDCGNGENTIRSGDGADSIETPNGSFCDVDAGTGDDVIWVGFGSTIHGGDGNDRITAVHCDSVFGDAGDDRIHASSDQFQSTVIFGGDGDDNIFTGDGADSIYGGAGRDTVHAGNGPDLLSGGGGHDKLFGQGGPDRLYGGRGNDRLIGGGGNDRLLGGEGADTIRGGPGTNAARHDDPLDELTDIQAQLV